MKPKTPPPSPTSGTCIPDLRIVGHSHGYLRGDALRAKVDEINALAPDYLWVALGVPYEQAFVEEFTPRLSNVGVIKTSGGLFNFLSGSRAARPAMDAGRGARMGLANLAGAAPAVLALSDHQSPRALSAVQQEPAFKSDTDRTPSNRVDMSDRPAILVTGGAGYIGSHCCRALTAAGYHPVAYDNFSTGHRSFVTGSLVTGDLAGQAALARAFAQHRYRRGDAFRGIEPGRRVRRRPAEILPQQRRRHAVAARCDARRRLRPPGVFLDRRGLWQCRQQGAARKLSLRADQSLRRLEMDDRAACSPIIAAPTGWDRSACAISTPAAPTRQAEIGELRDNETHLIPRAMMALQGHVADFAVFGDDYDTPDGTAIRDYIHVTDLAAAHVLALKLLMQGHCGGAFNLGTGTGFSVREILSAIAAETGREVPHVVKPRRAGDPTYLVADPTAARETLKFRPAHSDLATIIRTAWAWHRKAHPLKTAEPLRAGTIRRRPPDG